MALWESDGPGERLRVSEVASGKTGRLAGVPQPRSRWTLARAAGGDTVVVVESAPAHFEAFVVETGQPLGMVAASRCDPMGALAADPWGRSVALAWGADSSCGRSGMSLHAVRILDTHGGDDPARVDELVWSPGRVDAVGWSDNGSSLAFTEALDAGTWRMRVMDVSGAHVGTWLEAAGPLAHPAQNRDGTRSAVAEKHRVYVRDHAVDVGDTVQALRWTEPTEAFLAQTGAGAVWSIDAVSAVATPVVDADPGALLVGDPPSGEGPRWLLRCEGHGVEFGEGDDAECLTGIERATWSRRQDVLLLEGPAGVFLADPSGVPLEVLSEHGHDARWLP